MRPDPKRRKAAVTCVLCVFLLVIWMRGLHIQTVPQYQQEQERLAGELGLGTEAPQAEEERSGRTMQQETGGEQPSPKISEAGPDQTAGGGTEKNTQADVAEGGRLSGNTQADVAGDKKPSGNVQSGGTGGKKPSGNVQSGGTGSRKPSGAAQSGGTGSRKPSGAAQSGGTGSRKPSENAQSGGAGSRKPSENVQSGGTESEGLSGNAQADAAGGGKPSGDTQSDGAGSGTSSGNVQADGGQKPSEHAQTDGAGGRGTPESPRADGSGTASQSGQKGTEAAKGQEGQKANKTAGPPGDGKQDQAAPETKMIQCSLEITCAKLSADKGQAEENLWKYIPDDGQVLGQTQVQVAEGTTAYELLAMVCQAKGIAMDAVYTPMYHSYYVRGIANIYEKQAGNMSGWIYKVNGVSPNKGASSYVLSEGDVCRWCYTCDGRTS